MYTKLVLSFIVIFVVSNIIASLMSYYGSEMSSVDKLESQLTESLKIIDEEYYKTNLDFDSLENITKNNYIVIQQAEDLSDYYISDEAMNKITSGEIVHIRAKEHQHPENTGPIAIKHIGDQTIIATADFNNLGFSTRQLVMEINIRSLIIGSLLVIVVSRLMVKPIKELIEATKRVKEKDFEIKLDTKRHDEIGDLMNSFNDMAEELKATEILRDDFISDVSHEFKTPLTSIKGYTKLLKEASDEERAQYTDIIVKETDRLSQLTSNILTLNRLSNETVEASYETFSLDEQLRMVIVMLENKWSDKDLNLNIQLERINYTGHKALLYQVWFNILDNAIQHSYSHGQIDIILRNNNGVYVEIKDYGSGISEDEQKRVFDKFYKSDKARSEDGNGLGLAIVKAIIDMHKGTIELKSELEKYTQFTIKL